MHVGFIGLGSQGGPMAGRIIEAGFPTSLWARRPAALQPFAGTAAKVAGSPAELAAASDLVCLCVGDLGSGQTTKLLNNLLFTANLGTAATTLALGEALGVLPDRLSEVISRGSGNSFALNVLGGDTAGLQRLAGMAGALLQKDVRLLADVADAVTAAGGVVLDAADAALLLMEHPR